MIILGIDPGYRRIGFGVIEETHGRTRLLEAGILRIPSRAHADALLDIKAHLAAIFGKWKPHAVGIEKIYFSNNQKTAIKVAEARGVILSSVRTYTTAIHEYTPNEVKAGIAGYGNADKKAVLKMVRLIVQEPGLRVIDDASDAIALAIITAGRVKMA